MSKLKIKEVEYDMSSPINLEFRDRYIRSFGDVPPPQGDVKWYPIDGFRLEISSPSDQEFDVQIYDGTDCITIFEKINN
jgi:hypothetical protein